MDKVGSRMVVVGNKRKWRRDCVLPIGVGFGKGRLPRVKPVSMEDVSHHLSR